MGNEIALIWPMLRDKNLPYPPRAYSVVQLGLRRAVEQVYDVDEARLMGDRHVTGQDLCLGIRDVAIEQFGPLAKAVLESWNISQTSDFGNMVEALVEAGLFRMSDRDSFEDFCDVYDFDEAFGCELDVTSPAA
ncbi:MAG: Minf_1886 family protein [Planctomycetota bacterium]